MWLLARKALRNEYLYHRLQREKIYFHSYYLFQLSTANSTLVQLV